MTASIAVIGAPTSAGAFAPGQEEAPAALRAAGLVEALGASDRGDTPRFRWRVDHREPRAMNAEAVVDGVRAVAAKVEDALRAGERAGGARAGTARSASGRSPARRRRGAEPRLVYLDLHPDLNIAAVGALDGALDWTGVAHMLDVEGADERLAGAGTAAGLPVDDDLAAPRRPDPARCTAAERADDRRARPAASAPIGAARRSNGGGHAPPWSALAAGGGAASCTSTSTPSTSPTWRCRRTRARSRRRVRGRGGGPRGRARARRSARPDRRPELNPHHGAQDGADVARLARALAGALRPR